MRCEGDVLKIDCFLKDEISERENIDRGRNQRRSSSMSKGVLMNENYNESKDIFLIPFLC